MSKISNGVRVLVREKPSCGTSTISNYENRIFVEERLFICDQFLKNTSSQDDVYADIRPLIQKFIDGYNCTVLAYGQSGTGKSYTMGLQSENVDNSRSGIVPRALMDILEVEQKENCAISVSFLEIYNERVFDLLSDNPAEPINSKGSKFTGRVKRPLRVLFDAEVAIDEGNKNRRVRPTAMNNNSSRSHGIFIIERNSTYLYMVDLAGSEGVRRTGHKGDALAEGSYINLGLLAIGNILKALSDGNCYIPYRDTMLGSVLQDSLNANSFLALVVCISGNKSDESETTHSLTFAQKVMNYKAYPKTTAESKLQKRRHDVPSIFETPLQTKRPLASSTGLISRTNIRNRFPTLHKGPPQSYATSLPVIEPPNSWPSQTKDVVMESPNLRECVRKLNETLQKKNLKVLSLNFTALNADADTTSDVDTTINNVTNETTNSESEDLELDSTVIQVPCIEDSSLNEKLQCSVLNSTEIEEVPCNTIDAPVNSDKEECMKMLNLFKADFTKVIANTTVAVNNTKPNVERDNQIDDSVVIDQPQSCMYEKDNNFIEVNFAKLVSNRTVTVNNTKPNFECDNRIDDSVLIGEPQSRMLEENDQFIGFKVPEVPRSVATNDTNFSTRRRSVRIIHLQKQRDEAAEISQSMSQLVQPPMKRRRTVTGRKNKSKDDDINKQTSATTKPASNNKARIAHSTLVLSLLNKGDMKEMQLLPQVGKKTAYMIINYREIHGKFKSFDQLADAPFWRGKGWQRFQTANNLV